MKDLFLVAPYQIDPLYSAKKSIITQLCKVHRFKLRIAENKKTGKSLSAENTITFLNGCNLAICDLSYERPSCYYEIGYLQALDKKVYLICNTNTFLHQVLFRNSVRRYSDLDTYKAIIKEIFEEEALSLENRNI